MVCGKSIFQAYALSINLLLAHSFPTLAIFMGKMDVNKVVEFLQFALVPIFYYILLCHFALDYTVLPRTRGQVKVLPNKLWNNPSNPLLLIMNNYYKIKIK